MVVRVNIKIIDTNEVIRVPNADGSKTIVTLSDGVWSTITMMYQKISMKPDERVFFKMVDGKLVKNDEN